MRCPEDLAFDPAGNLYVADFRNNRVQVFSQNGTYLRTFGMHGSGPGELSSPVCVHVDHDYVYVVEWRNHRVSVFHTSGAFITSFGRWAVERENCITQLGSPLTRMDSCMSVTLAIIIFKCFEQYIFVHSRRHTMDHAAKFLWLNNTSITLLLPSLSTSYKLCYWYML